MAAASQLIWADFPSHCPGLAVLACHAKKSQKLHVTKLFAPAKMSLIFTRSQYLSN
jgi:hypothetical protein